MVKEDIIAIIKGVADEFEIDRNFLLAVAKAESNFDPTAISGAGAIGLFQVMPKTYAEIAREIQPALEDPNPYNPKTSARAGAYYMRKMLRRFGGHKELALAAYNRGPTWLSRYLCKRWFSRYMLKPAILGKLADETYDYVKKILRFEREIANGKI